MKKLYGIILISLCTLVLSSCASSTSSSPTNSPESIVLTTDNNYTVSPAATSSAQNSSLPADALDVTPNDFTLKDLDGNTVSSSSFNGKPTIINFFATWCKYCEYEMPYFKQLEEEYGDSINIVYIDTLEDVSSADIKAFFEELDMTYSNVLIDADSALLYSYSSSSIPLSIIIDPDGTIRKIQLGAFTSYKTLKNYMVNYGQLN